MTTYIEIHAIQSLPPSNVNRDESGTPKSAVYGGVNRARVSSQSWKRAVHDSFRETLPASARAVRTLLVVSELVNRIRALRPAIDEPEAAARAAKVLELAGLKVKAARKGKESDATAMQTEALVFLSNQQLDRLAELAVSAEDVSKSQAKEAADVDHGFEVALFGRMVASAPDLNVDAAVQVAHAISTHAVDPQADFYTAVDDLKSTDDDSGAGMMGTIEFSSSTLYRYAVVGVNALARNLGDPEATAEAVAAFVKAFIVSMPSGKANSFANQTLPDAVLVAVRESRPISLVGAFEAPVKRTGQGYVAASVKALADHAAQIAGPYDAAPTAAWWMSVGAVGEPLNVAGDRVMTMTELAEHVKRATRSAVGASA